MYASHEISSLKITFPSVDMQEALQNEIVEMAKLAITTFSVEKDIAKHIKCQLDSLKGGTWHVIVGKNFGSYITYDRNCFLHFSIGELSFLIFRIG